MCRAWVVHRPFVVGQSEAASDRVVSDDIDDLDAVASLDGQKVLLAAPDGQVTQSRFRRVPLLLVELDGRSA